MRSIAIVLVAALAACGSSGAARGTSTTPPPGAPAAGARPASADYSAESLCRRLDALSTRCPAFNLGRTEMGKCLRMFEQIAGGSKDPEALKTPTTRCLVEQTECDQIVACMAALSDDSKLRACDDLDNAGQRVGMPRAEWERRRGAGITTFRKAQSTKSSPNEMCGVPAATEWLLTLRCEDGSQPLKSIGDAEGIRSGNVGFGGRCGSIIDRYVALCPEASYEIFIDAYVCPDPP